MERRVVAVDGPPGAGKSELAARVAAGAAAAYPDGVIWVRVRGADAPLPVSGLQLRVATALGFEHLLPPREAVGADAFEAAFHETLLAKQAELAAEFDAIHTVGRAREVGSLDEVISAEAIRPYLIDRVRGS